MDNRCVRLMSASNADAIKFNKTGLSTKLLNGIPNNVQNKIVNWDLA